MSEHRCPECGGVIRGTLGPCSCGWDMRDSEVARLRAEVERLTREQEAGNEAWEKVAREFKAERDAALRRVEEARGLLREREWDPESGRCLTCGELFPHSTASQGAMGGHAPGCALAAFLAPSPGDAGASGEGA